jgi:hypothetical protein
MKNEILKRAMFAMPLSKESRNSGIMAGFDEEMPEEMPEEPETDMPQMARTPQNPEILMNTLRGDMRSTNARVQELAQMVGEEAAMETPPEVLALLQAQLAAPQGGIGALPQGQQMAPPMMPPQGGMPPEGMPPGMEGAGPFPQGGAEQAPPTPDGMPPMTAAGGAFITPFTRAAQFMGDKAAQYGPAINQYLGNLTMRAQPTVQRVTGGSPPMPLSVQGRESLVQGPAGTIVEGVGTKLAPYTSMGPLMSPTFTEGLKTGLQSAAREYPRVTEALSRVAPGLGLASGVLMAKSDLSAPVRKLFGISDSNEGRTAEQEAAYQALVSQIPGNTRAPADQAPSAAAPVQSSAATAATTEAEQAAIDERQLATADTDPLGTFINQKLKLFNERELKPKQKTRAERTKAEYENMSPLFQEILGDNKEDIKTNALLLLADAGFKLASSRQPTFAMAVGEASAGIPRGLMALNAQAKDRELKIKTAALSQAFSTIQEEDKYIQQLTVDNNKALNRAKELILKKDLEGGQVIKKDGGGGRLTLEDSKGNYLGMELNESSPTVKAVRNSRFNLNAATNPYVTERGPAPSMVVDKDALPDVWKSINKIDRAIGTVENVLDDITGIYGPAAFFKEKYNKLIVPVTPLSPVLETADKKARVDRALNTLKQNLATEGGSGKESVQAQQWVQNILPNFATTFFSDPEVAFKQYQSLLTGLYNDRHVRVTEAGYDNTERVMKTPALGTKNDPFVVSSNPEEASRMFNFLGKTVGTVRDPNAVVFLNINNTVQPFTATKLRSLIKE